MMWAVIAVGVIGLLLLYVVAEHLGNIRNDVWAMRMAADQLREQLSTIEDRIDSANGNLVDVISELHDANRGRQRQLDDL